jgi:hypothetical protein
LSLALKKHKGDKRKMSMNIERNNQVSRLVTKFGFDDKTSKQPLEKLDYQRLGLVTIVKQINVVAS